MPVLSPAARAVVRSVALSVDVVLFTPRRNELAVLLLSTAPSRGRGRAILPADALRADESLDDAASRVARSALGATPAFLEQVGALGGTRRQADMAQVAVVYFGLVAGGSDSAAAAEWTGLSQLPPLAARHKLEVDAALFAVHARVDQAPIAFRLLPPEFTLSELQSVYELLLGRRLHKASFRRALHASSLVEATDEWRSEGRGRPAQLFRYAPPRRRRQHRAVRLDLLV
jgi:8-oxo-dGTP diphosphatase